MWVGHFFIQTMTCGCHLDISFLEFCRFLVFSSPSVVIVVDANPYRKSLAAIHFVSTERQVVDRWNLCGCQMKQTICPRTLIRSSSLSKPMIHWSLSRRVVATTKQNCTLLTALPTWNLRPPAHKVPQTHVDVPIHGIHQGVLLKVHLLGNKVLECLTGQTSYTSRTELYHYQYQSVQSSTGIFALRSIFFCNPTRQTITVAVLNKHHVRLL